MNWIKEYRILSGEDVCLVPMEEIHFAELDRIAGDETIWKFFAADMSTTEKRLLVFSMALTEKAKGSQFPFVIIHKRENKIIGSTRLMDIEEKHLKLEIGWTWLLPAYWASRVNPECKLLLLGFCFETLKANRVQLRTDETNMRSRKAIAKIGGQFEGVLRKDWIRENGTLRNTVYYSLLDNEWESNKCRLIELLAKTKKII